MRPRQRARGPRGGRSRRLLERDRLQRRSQNPQICPKPVTSVTRRLFGGHLPTNVELRVGEESLALFSVPSSTGAWLSAPGAAILGLRSFGNRRTKTIFHAQSPSSARR